METVETVPNFILGGSKITAGGGCSHEIKRCLLLERKAMANLDSIVKSRDITLMRKVHLVQAMCFPVVMSGCNSWTLKKAKHQRFDTFELWCWRRLLRVPWTARRSNQSIRKEITPKYSLEELKLTIHWGWNSNTLATWCNEMTHQKTPWCSERLNVVGEGDDRGWDCWMVSPAQWTWIWAWELATDREVWPAAVHRVAKSQTQLSNWTELNGLLHVC